MKVHTGNSRDQEISGLAEKIAADCMVFAILAPAGYHIISLLELREENGNICWVVLQIAVHWYDDLPRRIIKCRHEGCRLAIIASEVHDLEFTPLCGHQPQRIHGPVCAAIVNRNDLEWPPESFQYRKESIQQERDVRFLVV